MWIEGIDISKYQGSIDQATWRALEMSGQAVAIVGAWHGIDANPHCEGNLLRAKSAGMVTATYTALNSLNGFTAVQNAKAACGSAWGDVAFVAIDCEINGITETTIRQAIQQCDDFGKQACIYTAYWWWHDQFGNSTQFAHMPLWNAYYDGEPDVDFGRLMYGGWAVSSVVMEQFTGSSQLAGITVDRNTILADWWVEEDQGDEPMTDEERRAFDELKVKADRTAAQQRAGGVFATIAGKALQGEQPSAEDKNQARFLLG